MTSDGAASHGLPPKALRASPETYGLPCSFLLGDDVFRDSFRAASPEAQPLAVGCAINHSSITEASNKYSRPIEVMLLRGINREKFPRGMEKPRPSTL